MAPLFLILSLLGFWIHPFDFLNLQSFKAHSFCLGLIPSSSFQSEYQAILCGEKLQSSNELIQGTGLIHLFVTFGFQIYLIQNFTKIMFHQKASKNLFLFTAILSYLWISSFHPAGLRAAVSVFLSELSLQQKLFWTRLQISVFSGFLCLALDSHLVENYSLLIGWTAALSFSFLSHRHFLIKNIGTYLVLLPILWGMLLPHPVLAIAFSLLTRPALYILIPLCILSCCHTYLLSLTNLFWKSLFTDAEILKHIFLPLQFGVKLSILQIWLYILSLMTLFLYFENRKLRKK